MIICLLNEFIKRITQPSFPNDCVGNSVALQASKGYVSPTKAFGENEEGRLALWSVFKFSPGSSDSYNSFDIRPVNLKFQSFPTEAFGGNEEDRLSFWSVFNSSFINVFPKEINLNKAILNIACGEVSCR